MVLKTARGYFWKFAHGKSPSRSTILKELAENSTFQPSASRSQDENITGRGRPGNGIKGQNVAEKGGPKNQVTILHRKST